MPWKQKGDIDYNANRIREDDIALSEPETRYQLEKHIGLRDEKTGKRLIQKLKPKHYRFVQLHLAGVSSHEIGQALGVNDHTISTWLHDPLVQQEIQAGKQTWEMEFDALYGRAIDAVRAGLGDVDPQHRLRAAGIYFKQKQESAALQAGGGKETAEDIIARMLQINIQINQQEVNK